MFVFLSDVKDECNLLFNIFFVAIFINVIMAAFLSLVNSSSFGIGAKYRVGSFCGG